MLLDRKQLYRFLAESIGEKVSSDNDEDIIKKADRCIRDEYADLGLPSGTLWAKCNLGAEYEWESGGYYGWGKLQPYKQGDTEEFKKYGYDVYGLDYDLENHKDAAFVALGKKWHIPSTAQIKELIGNTYSFWCRHKGVIGIIFVKVKSPSHKGKWNIKELTNLYIKEWSRDYIFIPASGSFDLPEKDDSSKFAVFWGRNLFLNSPYGNIESFYADKKGRMVNYILSRQGLPIRAVCTEKDII